MVRQRNDNRHVTRRGHLRARLIALGLWLAVWTLAAATAGAAVRIKDIADFEGIRDNMLVGYGLVVGLNGTGDTLINAPFTRQSLEAMLERLGVNTRGTLPLVENVAAVMVTATLPPFARQGTRIDVSVSSLGDAESLLGGTLLVTPLVGADGEVYVVSQGQVSVAGFTAQGAAGSSITKGVPTAGRVSNGGIIEREIGYELVDMDRVSVSLRNPDLTTAIRVSQAINAMLNEPASRATDPATIVVAIPEQYRDNIVGLLTDIEQLRVQPDQIARVVIDEVSGTIVIGENVRISTVAIAQGNLTIRITETPQVSQPGAFAPDSATTETVQRSAIEIDEQTDRKLFVLPEGVSLQELVDGLNALGVGPRDIISILQTIKAAGALQAELEVL
ncbi:MAG: flagellar basal body P-ring protein FlgI [Alphaproteobacteria bacterium]|nr:flagellar basal body P-ring protein FlgI [Alphaproteobacteria bacterium]MDP6515848.1 flagellar basal body P-ring protein FlgI [Alphaproteobacteria bacterium]